MQWTGCESNQQPLGYESDTLGYHYITAVAAPTCMPVVPRTADFLFNFVFATFCSETQTLY